MSGFAQKFHDAALTEGNTEFISQYLETAEEQHRIIWRMLT